MSEPRFGPIPGCPIGSHFASRQALSRAGVHRPRIAGIAGSGRAGADSVVLAGGYQDGEDYGDMIFYTGHGGPDPQTHEQIRHQVLTRGNRALAQNRLHGLPVRVIRGAGFRSPYAPASGYRYDGLYTVDDYWRGVGARRIFSSGVFGWSIWMRTHSDRGGSSQKPRTPRRSSSSTTIAVRYAASNSEALPGRMPKRSISGPSKPRTTARDTPENMLCVCPNCHILLSIGGVGIGDDFGLIGRPGRLYVDFRHRINIEHVRYRRQHYPVDSDM